MSGIYIHIPICATRCIYCDFYSTTLRGREDRLVTALTHEMDRRRDFLTEAVRTVYLGGGTPSQLGWPRIQAILDAVAERFDLSQCQEVTMEANPEDIATGDWQWGRVNRVSMGVQSMVDSELHMLHRRHDSQRVRQAVAKLREAGIGNVSLDLMYGLPQQTMESWAYSIDEVLKLQPQHISAYNLMVEEGTALHQQVERGLLTPCNDDTCLQMADLLRRRLKQAGYEQYEISNYAKPGYESKHNSAYWTQTPYLGLGPGAHSYDGRRLRCWNEPDLPSYLNNICETGQETLTDQDLYNELVMLGLRTMRGIGLGELTEGYQKAVACLPHPTADGLPPIHQTISHLQQRQLVTIVSPALPADTAPRLCLTAAGLALADEVIRDLIV